jgi:DNA-binding NtrC family response regulator
MQLKHGQPPHVLVLEDDAEFRGVLLELLEDEGLDVSGCDSYESLRMALNAFGSAIVVADFWGVGHANLSPRERDEIRELGRQVPTILLTGRAWATSTAPEDLNVACVLPKPPGLDELVAQIRRCLSMISQCK